MILLKRSNAAILKQPNYALRWVTFHPKGQTTLLVGAFYPYEAIILDTSDYTPKGLI